MAIACELSTNAILDFQRQSTRYASFGFTAQKYNVRHKEELNSLSNE